jgi:hypothetical protein
MPFRAPKHKFQAFYQFSHAEVFITEKSPHKADKALIYRGHLDLKAPTDIFQAVFIISVACPHHGKINFPVSA